MKTVIGVLLFTLFLNPCFSQIKGVDLEFDTAISQELDSLISQFGKYENRDYKNAEVLAQKVFKLDAFNSTAIYYLSRAYDENDKTKRKRKFFEKLKRKYPNRPEPYVLSAEFNYWAIETADTSSYGEFEKALRVDSTYARGYFLFAKTLYRHSQRLYKNDSIQNCMRIAIKARENMIIAIKYDSSYYLNLRYAILQISTLIGDSLKFKDFLKKDYQNWYLKESYPYIFPYSSFISLPEGWQSNYNLDLQRFFEGIQRRLNSYSSQLSEMGEFKLFTKIDDTVYRFAWLRAFRHPVIIRLQKKDGIITLNWKVCDRGMENSPCKLVVDESKTLTETEWNEFQKLIINANYWSLSTTGGSFGMDGSRWIIEGVERDKYNVVDRWAPRDSEYQQIGKYLISLTNLEISKKNMY